MKVVIDGNKTKTARGNKAKELMEHISELFTKEEIIAMLTELQLKIEEKFNDRPFSYNHRQRTEFYRDIDEIIQQKIDKLKEGA